MQWNCYTCTDQHVRENEQLPHCHSFNNTIAVSLNNSSDKADVEVAAEVKPRSVGNIVVNVASPTHPSYIKVWIYRIYLQQPVVEKCHLFKCTIGSYWLI